MATVKASKSGLDKVARMAQLKGWTKTRTPVWWQDAHTTQATLRRFWRGISIHQEAFVDICKAVGLEDWESIIDRTVPPMPEPQSTPNPLVQDWENAPDVLGFYGRTDELNQLKRWVLDDRCKVVTILGMGGMGKTALTVNLADQIHEQFECLVWRSLQPKPTLPTLLKSLMPLLMPEIEPFSSTQEGLMLLIQCLQKRRCLIVLDELEVIFQSQQGKISAQSSPYQKGYEDYREFLRRLSVAPHKSCIVLTSREKPEEIAALEGETLPIRCLRLRGLRLDDARALFKAKGFSGTEKGLPELVDLYGGNPLALKVITTMIEEIFNGNVAAFLSQNTMVLGDRLRSIVQQQLERLSELEKEIVYWLMIERYPVSFTHLQKTLLSQPPGSALLEAIASLERRSLIDKMTLDTADDSTLPQISAQAEPISVGGEIKFTLQPLVMKSVTEEFIEQAIEEICAVLDSQDVSSFKVLRNHALSGNYEMGRQSPYLAKFLQSGQPGQMTTTSSNTRIPGMHRSVQPNSRILKPLVFYLARSLNREPDLIQKMTRQLPVILPLLQGGSSDRVRYLGRNLMQLLIALKIDPGQYDWRDIPMR
ncbi:MAG: hypothetical protein KME16_15960 [Scytolyngbya sp. HA4215-MV1]|jgi:hypothetical protein|nr:hypothetical protein [Scytolyngbya sp. HA4215-MV1]